MQLCITHFLDKWSHYAFIWWPGTSFYTKVLQQNKTINKIQRFNTLHHKIITVKINRIAIKKYKKPFI